MANHKFFNKLQYARSNRLPFVAYRLPNELQATIMVQKSNKLFTTKDLSESGFVFAPFDSSETIVLIPDGEAHTETFEITDDFYIKTIPNHQPYDQKSSLEQEAYTQLIDEAKALIEQNKLEKVVLSRKIYVGADQLNIEEVFKRMLYKYPNSFIYLWSHPSIGTWLGTTPEQLLCIKNNHLKTVSLAGTQVYKSDVKAVWDAKDIKEQELVTTYLSKLLTKLKIDFKIGTPTTLRAGNLVHICTEIKGKLNKDISIFNLVSNLHPTPAVAGLPKQDAIKFIQEHELYDRSFYTGYLGFINKKEIGKKSTELFVNLRCMQFKNQMAFVYVGGGITADSIPINEWKETEAKSKTLINVL